MDDYFPFDNELQASYLIMDKSKSSPAELKTQINARFLSELNQTLYTLQDKKRKALLFNNEYIRHGDVTTNTSGLNSNTSDYYMYIIEDLNVYRSKFNQWDSKHVSMMASNKANEGKILLYFQKKKEQ
jgi:hypothetical protein